MDSAIIAGIMLVAMVVYVWKRMNKEEKIGIDSDEKRLIATAVRTRNYGEERVIPLYAYHDISVPSRHYRKKNCLYYTVGVNEERMYVTQFHVHERDISFGKTNIIHKSDLKWIEGSDSYVCTMGFVFNFHNGKKFVFYLDESNVKVDDKCKVNIQQKEEMQEAYDILRQWMTEVNQMKEPLRPVQTKVSKVFYGIAKISLIIGVLGLVTYIVCQILVNRGLPFSEVGRYSTIAIGMGFFLAFVGGMFGLIFESGSKGYL